MARELIYTSAHRGLKPGTRGFCTVAHTKGMKPSVVRLLESLSSYKSPLGNKQGNGNQHPTAVSHYRGFATGESFNILSQVGYSGRDFTNRQNKLAYHLVLDPDERPKAGPAWLARQDGVLLGDWKGEPRLIPEPKDVPSGNLPPETFAANWKEITGDAGWAGILLRELNRNPAGIIYLVYEPGMPILSLIEDLTAALEVPKRWLLTFNTVFMHMPAGVNCTLRCCLPDAPPLKDVRATTGTFKLDLTKPLREAPNNIYTRIARGEKVSAPQKKPRRKTAESGAEKKTGEKTNNDFLLLKNRTRRRLRMKPDDPRRKGRS
ncbi:MAG: hypothetical protein R6V56_01740 [Lentisphaeria bacterium]